MKGGEEGDLRWVAVQEGADGILKGVRGWELLIAPPLRDAINTETNSKVGTWIQALFCFQLRLSLQSDHL